MGGQDFAMNSPAKNNMDHDFEFTRLEYYISGITIIHDNGTATPVPDTWILVNAASATEVELGSFPVTQVEAIHFTIGVDPEHNHLDPASFPSSHPLGPKSPSMHWGWTAGYRFLALEGYGGPQYNQLVQLHGLGDQNYIKSRVNLHATAANNEVTINLDADYTRALETISVNGDVNAEEYFSLYPNPTQDGLAFLTINSTEDEDYEMTLTDMLGRQISNLKVLKPNTTIDVRVPEAGIYFVRLIQNGQSLGVVKLISQ